MTEALSNWSRPYFQEYTQRPQLFFVVFGAFQIGGQTEQARAVLPSGADIRVIEAAYFRNGACWDLCRKEARETAERVENCRQAVVVKAQIEQQKNLDYLKETLDFLAHLTDEGGEVVYDPYTLSWYPKEDWNERIEAGQIFNPFDHVVILRSEESGVAWLHTRGMIKFGRPDLSARPLVGDEQEIQKVIDRFINFQALGGVVQSGREIRMPGLKTTLTASEIKGSLDDPDFNNFHVEILPRE